MKDIYSLFLLIILNAAIPTVYPQNKPVKAEFRSPVDYPITLAGSFAEIRRNHFHSGIDIRTGGVEGKPIYAIADGYVSRVNVSSTGFGKALYLNHPNGYTSLYGHLQQRYAGPIAAWVKKQHYQRESFVMDVEVPPGELKVKKGDIIAYSGNSGASGGPHLHFEIRDSKTQEIIDPLDFGFVKPDATLPKISGLKIYPFDDRAQVNFTNKPLSLQVLGGNGNYAVKFADTVMVTGNIIFGIETSDIADGGLKTGVHVIHLFVDGMPVFSQDINRFAFAQTRYVNSILDYPAFVQQGKKIQRSYIAPNNQLDVFAGTKDRGILHFSDTRSHQIKYVVSDAFGNSAQLVFRVKSHPPPNTGARPGNKSGSEHPADTDLITYKNDNKVARNNFSLNIPKEAVYEDFNFRYEETPPVRDSYASVFHLQDKLTPLHTYCEIRIKCDKLPAAQASKAVIVSVGPGNKFVSVGGKWENGWVSSRIREFGNYTVALDTEKPVIRPLNISGNKNVKKQSSIRMSVSDNLSGVDSYRGTLNGKWILMDYDAKNRSLVYLFDEHIRPGKNLFILTVSDAVGNVSKYEATIIR